MGKTIIGGHSRVNMLHRQLDEQKKAHGTVEPWPRCVNVLSMEEPPLACCPSLRSLWLIIVPRLCLDQEYADVFRGSIYLYLCAW